MKPEQRRVAYSSEEIRQKVLSLFDAPRPGWASARNHCPDIMIMARDEEAVRRGDYQLVLGELHLAVNTVCTTLFVEQHPSPEELARAYEADMARMKVVPVLSRLWPTLTTRTSRGVMPPDCYLIEMAHDTFVRDRTKVLPLSELLIEQLNDELVVRTHDRRLQFDLIEFLSEVLSGVTMNCFRIAPPLGHTPRVTIDRLIICRETWRFVTGQMPFAFIKDEANRFSECRRWARAHDLPRFVFVKSLAETKPFYVDFESLVLVNNFAKAVRRSDEEKMTQNQIVITEMLPSIDQLWLPDAQGGRYTSELRIVAVDSAL